LGDWSWDAVTDMVTFSDRAAEIFGIPPGPYMTWTQMRELLYEADRDRARIQVEGAIAHHSDYDTEYRVIRPDGQLRWVAAKGRAQYDNSGRVLGMLGVVQDVSDRKHAESERDQLLVRERTTREQAETANRIKDEFLAVLSHELRSPLNPILGWAKLLQTGTLNPQKAQYALETIERSAKLQTQLIEDLLDVSRILRGKLVLSKMPINLVPTLEAALETVRLAAEAKSIQLHLHLADTPPDHQPAPRPSPPFQVLGDSARLQQIVWNLLSNAVKFTPPEGRVEVRLMQQDGHAIIQVCDTGKGISPEFLPYVFEYFRQEDGTTTRKFGGLGLGLAIVRHLTELHGGQVAVESLGENQGATFTVCLPLLSQPTARTVDGPPSEILADLSSLHILVVDDEADIRDIVAFILEQAGAQVSLAASAQEAIAHLSPKASSPPRSLPQVLVCDIGMPEMDGYHLIRQIRTLNTEQPHRIAAIALTAYAGELDQRLALEAGFDIHLPKPVEPEVLVRTVTRLVSRHPTVDW